MTETNTGHAESLKHETNLYPWSIALVDANVLHRRRLLQRWWWVVFLARRCAGTYRTGRGVVSSSEEKEIRPTSLRRDDGCLSRIKCR